MIGSAQWKNDHLKLEIDVDTELTENLASWLVTCLTKNYGRRQGMNIHDQAHRILTSLCHTTVILRVVLARQLSSLPSGSKPSRPA
jgi:hypothetical protein